MLLIDYLHEDNVERIMTVEADLVPRTGDGILMSHRRQDVWVVTNVAWVLDKDKKIGAPDRVVVLISPAETEQEKSAQVKSKVSN